MRTGVGARRAVRSARGAVCACTPLTVCVRACAMGPTAAAALGVWRRVSAGMDAGLSEGVPAVESAAAEATPAAEPTLGPHKKRASKRIGVAQPGAKRRCSVTDTMQSDAEKLMSAVERGLIKFEDMAVMPGMPIGGIGIAPGKKGQSAFRAYIKQPAVVERLVSQGFVASAKGGPHPWHLIRGKGVVSPADKVICQSLTAEQREKIEASRVAALERKRSMRQDEATEHRLIDATEVVIAALGAHYPDTRPCSLCGVGDEAGTVICCDKCNTPFHDSCAGAPRVSGDWLCAACN